MTEEPESFVIRLTSGERLHYLDWGGPADAHLAPIVLLHGIAQTGWAWSSVARRLSSHTRVLALDMRGHGQSDSPRSGFELDSLALDALTVMAGNGWGSEVQGPPAVLGGHGFGAQVAAVAAADDPDSVAGVCLVDGAWEEVGEATRSAAAEYLAQIAEPPEVLASMAAFLADRRDFDPRTWDADEERAARAQVDEKPAGHVALVARPAALRAVVDAMFAYAPEEVLPRMRAPLTILVADSTADDEGARERKLALDDMLRARDLASCRPAHVVRFAGTGHNLMRYRPAEVADELLALATSG